GRQYLPLWDLPAHSRGHQGCSRNQGMRSEYMKSVNGVGPRPNRSAAVSVVGNFSRRGFLGTIFSAGAFVLAAPLVLEDPALGAEINPAKGNWQPSVYLGVQPDGTVVI